MRAFVLVGHTQPLAPDFPLNDLPGGAGRLDVLCRSVTAGLLLSHDIRTDVSVWAVIQDELAIEFRGSEIRHLRPDERSTAALFAQALETGVDRVVSAHPVESSPGVYVRRQGLGATLDELADEHEVGVLHPEGEVITPVSVPSSPAFVLSDHEPFTDEELALFDERGLSRFSLGPRVIHGDQAIAVAHNVLDRAEAESAYSGNGVE